MGNKILKQHYHSCNVTSVVLCKKHKFLTALTLWSSYHTQPAPHFLENVSICSSYTSENPVLGCPISANLAQAWVYAAGGDPSSSGIL